MKSEILKLCPVVLLFLFLGASCQNREIGEVPYALCPCNEEQELANLEVPDGEAYLFNDSIPEQVWFQISKSNKMAKWIILDSKTNLAVLYISKTETSLRKVCKICNYPDFAKEWVIPQNGCMVYYKGIGYDACTPAGLADAVYIDYVLTNLRLK